MDPQRPVARPTYPLTSRRPNARLSLEEREAIIEEERERQRRMADVFSSLEARADLDPYFEDNPIARLGWREGGGMGSVDFFGVHPEDAYTETRFGGEEPVSTVAYGANVSALPVISHEFGHVGYNVLEDLIRSDPDLLERFGGLKDRDFEEMLIELYDNPDDTWNRKDAPPLSMAETIDFPRNDYFNVYRKRSGAPSGKFTYDVDNYNEMLRQFAEEELSRRGEPPRARMSQPESDRGIGALFKSLFGLK
jgi:hypothetical protein